MSDVHRVLSPPALLSSCRITCPRLLSRSQSIHLISGLPLVLLSCFPSILVFSKDPCPLTMSPKQNGCSLVISATSDVTGLICSRTHPFFFFFWSSLPTPFQMNHFFFFPYQPPSLSGRIWRDGMVSYGQRCQTGVRFISQCV